MTVQLFSTKNKHGKEKEGVNPSFVTGEKMSEIEIRNLTKTFDIKGRTVHALKNISLSIEQGDTVGIIGMSGAGKSTLVRYHQLSGRNQRKDRF